MLPNARVGWEGVQFPGKKRYEGVRFNVIGITRGWVSTFQKKRYVTLECPLIVISIVWYSLGGGYFAYYVGPMIKKFFDRFYTISTP